MIMVYTLDMQNYRITNTVKQSVQCRGYIIKGSAVGKIRASWEPGV